jgi:hypothetical protein
MPLSNNLLELVVSTSHTSREKVAMNMQPDSVLRWPNFHSAYALGKTLLVAAHAGVLDYAIAMVAALSESNPFVHLMGNKMNRTTKTTKSLIRKTRNEQRK